jgi:hypothetical protein
LEFAVKGVEAIPDALVATVNAVLPFGKVPLAPEGGAVKVMFVPAAGLPNESSVTDSGEAKTVPATADCGVEVAAAVKVWDWPKQTPAQKISARIALVWMGMSEL